MANLTEGQHTSEFLISEGDESLQGSRSREAITVLSGQNLKAGHVVGRTLIAPTIAAPAAQGNNTGNGTFNTVTASSNLGDRQGTYTVTFEDATHFTVWGPDDGSTSEAREIGHGATGSAFDNEINFTITAGGTAFVPGDSFTIAVTGGTYKYKEYNPANTDGSQRVWGVLYQNTNATSADTSGTLIARGAAVRASDLVWFSGATAVQIATGQAQLTFLGIIVR